MPALDRIFQIVNQIIDSIDLITHSILPNEHFQEHALVDVLIIQSTCRRQSITASSATLLVVLINTSRQPCMDNKPNILFVNAHSKGRISYNDFTFTIHPFHLIGLFYLLGQLSMIFHTVNPMFQKFCMDIRNIFW